MNKNPFGKLYKKLKKMSKRHDFTLRSMHNIPRKDGGELRIVIQWGKDHCAY